MLNVYETDVERVPRRAEQTRWSVIPDLSPPLEEFALDVLQPVSCLETNRRAALPLRLLPFDAVGGFAKVEHFSIDIGIWDIDAFRFNLGFTVV